MYGNQIETMKTTIGKITKDQQIKAMKKTSREIELSLQVGWTAKNKVHKSKKTYNRKQFKLQSL